ncbi:MAG: hypothetical protein EA396_03675 [Anaerolineaceae bacterium]|nr:MAG: hypothetical protein EA396_03675 [Anaerolineaceae bacterium]
MNDLYGRLLHDGLVQFGTFNGAPYLLNTGLLPSYPAALALLAERAAPLIGQAAPVDRLVCTASAWPIGMALSLRLRLPLVYSLGTDAAGVHDLIGAYDMGHPACLLVNLWDGDAAIRELIDKARRVGLMIDSVVALFGWAERPLDGVAVHVLVDLPQMARALADGGEIPPELRTVFDEV